MSNEKRLIHRKKPHRKSVPVENPWGRLERWFTQHLPEVMTTLQLGATSRQIEGFEKAIGQPLPDCVRQFYRIHNGQGHWPEIGLVFGLELLSLEDALERRQWWKKDMESTDAAEAVPYDGKSFPEMAVGLDYENKGWIPIGADAGGNHLGIDLAPGATGTLGQVINFG